MEWFQENEWIVDRETGHDICVMDDECGTKDQRAKNAALIAAAPELLAALKLVLDEALRHDEADFSLPPDKNDEPYAVAARAAIAKAEGKLG